MRTVTFSKLDEFQRDQEMLSVYIERFELFAAANSIVEKRIPMFLTVIGRKTYTLQNLFAPENCLLRLWRS